MEISEEAIERAMKALCHAEAECDRQVGLAERDGRKVDYERFWEEGKSFRKARLELLRYRFPDRD